MAGLRCYQNCKSGYHCSTDAALTGTVNCRQPLPTDCGGACAADTNSCVANTFEMIQGVIDAVVNTALLVMSFGTSTAAVLAKNTVQNMARQTAKNARRIAMRVGHQNFKSQVRTYRYKLVRKAITDNMKGKVTEVAQKNMADYAMSESDSLAEFYIKKFEEEESAADRVNKITQKIDPTGIAAAIDSSTGASVDDSNKQAANWLNVASFVDPTGITGAVAGIIKHSMCESTWGDQEEKLEGNIINSPTAAALPTLNGIHVYLYNLDHGAYAGMCNYYNQCGGSLHDVYGYKSKKGRTKFLMTKTSAGGINYGDAVKFQQPDHNTYLGVCGNAACGEGIHAVRGFPHMQSRIQWIIEGGQNGNPVSFGSTVYLKSDDHHTYLCMCNYKPGCDGSNYDVLGCSGKPSRARFRLDLA